MLNYRIHSYLSLTSTQDEALRLWHAHHPIGTCVLSGIQTKGRGTRGRYWVSEKGNFFLTIIMDGSYPFFHLPFLISLALFHTVSHFIPSHEVNHLFIKWPNDLILYEQKLSGILIESIMNGSETRECYLVGIGVNLKPLNTLYGASYLSNVTPQDFLEEFLKNLSQFETMPFDKIRTFWIEHAWKKDELIKTQLKSGEVLEGTFVDISKEGFLILKEKDEKIKFLSSADIFI